MNRINARDRTLESFLKGVKRVVFKVDQSKCVDARQRNERNARMGAEETGLEQVDSSAEFCCFY
jgi:hypothetical protein